MISQEWDYSPHAEYYKYRPNYAEAAIYLLCEKTGVIQKKTLTADVGAGTGNLTLLLLAKGLRCVAVEPNREMRRIGIERTLGMDVEWRDGSGEKTGLESSSVDLFAMGSSFNTTEREQTLKEAHRVLKKGGCFSCLWNHRDLEDPVQKKVEEIIQLYVPSYQHGTRRENQTKILSASGLFSTADYFEENQYVMQSIRDYLLAWRSVKNRYWNLETKEGENLFQKIMECIQKEFSTLAQLKLRYTTRVWIARKK